MDHSTWCSVTNGFSIGQVASKGSCFKTKSKSSAGSLYLGVVQSFKLSPLRMYCFRLRATYASPGTFCESLNRYLLFERTFSFYSIGIWILFCARVSKTKSKITSTLSPRSFHPSEIWFDISTNLSAFSRNSSHVIVPGPSIDIYLVCKCVVLFRGATALVTSIKIRKNLLHVCMYVIHGLADFMRNHIFGNVIKKIEPE